MKKIFLVALWLCSLTLFAQNQKLSADEKLYSYTSVTEKPVFLEGNKNLDSILAGAFEKSDIRLDKKSKNKVYTLFTIEKDGSLTNISIVSKVKMQKEDEIISIFKNLPNWKAGSLKDKTVRVHHSYEITEILKV